MSDIKTTAAAFFDACETGKGWGECAQYCHADASFGCEADTFAAVKTVEDYTNGMQGLIAGPLPDASYEMKAFAVDDERNSVTGYAVFKATHTGEGGPVPPTGKSIVTDYVYVMEFEDGKVRHMTKIWNDVWALRMGGWM